MVRDELYRRWHEKKLSEPVDPRYEKGEFFYGPQIKLDEKYQNKK